MIRPHSITRLLFLVVVALTTTQSDAIAAVIDSDDASAGVYADGWNNFDDGSINPDGLGGWVLGGGASDPGTIAIQSSLSLGGGAGEIDSSGASFKLHDKTGGFVDVFRFFDPSGLNVGETFSMEMAVNFRGGFKGIDLRDASSNAVFNFNIGGDDYTVSQATTGNGSIGNAYSSNTTFALSFTQSSAAGGVWSVVRGGDLSGSLSGTYAGLASSIKLYSGSQGTFDEDGIYYNNLKIIAIPEPSTGVSFGLLILAGAALRRRA